MPPWTVSQGAAGSERTSGASSLRSLVISCVADTELLLVKVPVAAVEPTKNWATSAVVAFKVRSERTVMSCSRPMLPAAKEASSVPSSARLVVVAIGCGALQQWRVQEGGGREAVDGEVRRGIHTRAVLQVRDPLAQAVEICDEGSGCPTGRLALGPTVTADLEGAAVAQDGLSGEGRLAEQVPDYPGRELGLDQIEDSAALCARAVDEVPGIEWAQVIRPQKAAVRHGLGPGITAESQGTLIAQNGVP